MIIPCPECKAHISDQAPSCPKCGNPIKAHLVEKTAKKYKYGMLISLCLAFTTCTVGPFVFTESPDMVWAPVGFFLLWFCLIKIAAWMDHG